MADTASLRRLLRCRLDRSASIHSTTIQIAQLDSPRHRLRPRRATLGTNLVGNVWIRPLPSLGRRIYFRGSDITQLVAMARCSGRITGARLWYDPVANTDAHAYLLHFISVTDLGLHSYHLCPLFRTE